MKSPPLGSISLLQLPVLNLPESLGSKRVMVRLVRIRQRPTCFIGILLFAGPRRITMGMRVTLGNPFLIFIYSLALLLIGCAIGIHWRTSPCVAVCLALLGALLTVIHDTATGFLFFWTFSKMQARGQRSQP
jgi:hypothetical protein